MQDTPDYDVIQREINEYLDEHPEHIPLFTEIGLYPDILDEIVTENDI